MIQPKFSLELDRSTIKAASGSAEGLIFIGPKVIKGTFDKVFQARFGETPDIPARQAYDAIHLLAKAIENQGTDTNKVLQWLDSFEQYDGASGHYSRKDGILEVPTQFYVVRGSDYEELVSH